MSGVVVTIANGRCSLFSDPLLYATLPRAEDLTHIPNPDEEDYSPSGETIVTHMTRYVKLLGRSSLKDGHSLTNANELSIVAVDRSNVDQLYVSFSDGTFAVYAVRSWRH